MKENALLSIRDAKVRKANDLIQRSRFNLSLQQQKIVLYLIAQISPFDEDFKTYTFTIQDFCRVCGITSDSGRTYNDLKIAIQDIADKSLWVKLANGDETLLRWIEKARVTGNGGDLEIRLDNDLRPFLLQLKQNYTEYEIAYTLNFKSKYTIRLYELIKSIHYHDLTEYKRRYSVEELRRLLDAEAYTEYRNFKQRVLTQAVKEINEYSDKTISVEEIRRGRKVLAVEFTISTKDTLETLRIRDEIDKTLGMLPGQTSLWDELNEKGYI